jgi:hypothetical protein
MTKGPAKFELWLTLADDDNTKIPVQQVALSYQINAIPMAVCQLAVGRHMPTNEISPVHKLLEQLTMRRRIKIWFRPSGTYVGDIEWPEEPTVIFEGYITGFNPSVALAQEGSSGSASVQLWAIDRMADLAFSPILSGLLHPHSTIDYAFSALLGSRFITQVESAPTILGTTKLLMPLFEGEAVSDFWAGAVKPLLFLLIVNNEKEKHVDLLCLNDLLEAGRIHGMPPLLEALNRLEGPISVREDFLDATAKPLVAKVSSLYSKWYSGLIIQDDIKPIVGDMRQVLADIPVKEAVQRSAWDLLVEIAATFEFSIIPRNDGFIIAPVGLGSNEPYEKRIKVTDQGSIASTSTVEKVLRAVIMMSKSGMVTNNDAEDITSIKSFHCYVSEDEKKKTGLVLTVPVPVWLSYYLFAPSNLDDMAAAAAPGAARPAPPPKIPDPLENLAKSYVHLVYIREMLRPHSLTVSCSKVRFDIAPGSNVIIEGIGERFGGKIHPELRLVRDFIGIVTQVAIVLNSALQQANTGFTMNFVRPLDSGDKDLVMEHPVLYKKFFKGAPIIDKYFFEDEDK